MRKVSEKTKCAKLAEPDIHLCCYRFPHDCGGRIEWHHNLIFAGKQSDDPKTILNICHNIHELARNRDVKERLDLIMLERMTEEERVSISSATNYNHRYQYLKNKHVY
jgi:hypothetical protein